MSSQAAGIAIALGLAALGSRVHRARGMTATSSEGVETCGDEASDCQEETECAACLDLWNGFTSDCGTRYSSILNSSDAPFCDVVGAEACCGFDEQLVAQECFDDERWQLYTECRFEALGCASSDVSLPCSSNLWSTAGGSSLSGGVVTPSPTPPVSPTPTSQASPLPVPAPTPSTSNGETPPPSPAPLLMPGATITPTAVATSASTPEPTEALEPAKSPSPTPNASVEPTPAPMPGSTTAAPVAETVTPAPTEGATPASSPAPVPTQEPTASRTRPPTPQPFRAPTPSSVPDESRAPIGTPGPTRAEPAVAPAVIESTTPPSAHPAANATSAPSPGAGPLPTPTPPPAPSPDQSPSGAAPSPAPTRLDDPAPVVATPGPGLASTSAAPALEPSPSQMPMPVHPTPAPAARSTPVPVLTDRTIPPTVAPDRSSTPAPFGSPSLGPTAEPIPPSATGQTPSPFAQPTPGAPPSPSTASPVRDEMPTPTVAPMVLQPTLSPTGGGGVVPTGIPMQPSLSASSMEITPAPRAEPTPVESPAPTPEDTPAPVARPALAPTPGPTLAPMVAPTSAPVRRLTPPPVPVPPDPNAAPSPAPTRETTVVRTAAPEEHSSLSSSVAEPSPGPSIRDRSSTLSPILAPTPGPMTHDQTSDPLLIPTESPAATASPVQRPTGAPLRERTRAPFPAPPRPTTVPTLMPARPQTAVPVAMVPEKTAPPTTWSTDAPIARTRGPAPSTVPPSLASAPVPQPTDSPAGTLAPTPPTRLTESPVVAATAEPSRVSAAPVAPVGTEPTTVPVTPTPSPYFPGGPGGALPSPSPAAAPTLAPVPVETVLPSELGVPLSSSLTVPPLPATVMPSPPPVGAATPAPSGVDDRDVPATPVPSADAALPSPAPSTAPTRRQTRSPVSGPAATLPTPSPTVAAGLSNAARVSGSFTANGVPDALVDDQGEAAMVQGAVCALQICPGGEESVIVTTDTQARRAQALEMTEATAILVRQRRLADLEGILFQVPLATGSGDVSQGPQRAAELINKVADPAILSDVSSFLGVDVDDVDFVDLAFYQGEEFAISNEFGTGTTQLSSVRDTSSDRSSQVWAAVVAAVILSLGLVLVACLMRFCLGARQGHKGHSTKAAKGSPDDTRGIKFLVGKASSRSFSKGEDVEGMYLVKPAATTALPPSSQYSAKHKSPPRSRSYTGSDESGGTIVSGKFKYTNPMIQADRSRNALAKQYYDGERNASINSARSENPEHETENPLYGDDPQWHPFVVQPLEAGSESDNESYRDRLGSTSSHDSFPSGSYASSSGYGGYHDHDSAARSYFDSSSTFESSGRGYTPDISAGSGAGGSGAFSSGGRRVARRERQLSVASSSSRWLPPGLSPVAETVYGRGESYETLASNASSRRSGSSSTTSSDSSCRSIDSGPIPEDHGGAGGGSAMDDTGERDDRPGEVLARAGDEENQSPSPHAVVRPLQPLLATSNGDTPMSSAGLSRSNSLASADGQRSRTPVLPRPPAASASPGGMVWVPGAGLLSGGSTKIQPSRSTSSVATTESRQKEPHQASAGGDVSEPERHHGLPSGGGASDPKGGGEKTARLKAKVDALMRYVSDAGSGWGGDGDTDGVAAASASLAPRRKRLTSLGSSGSSSSSSCVSGISASEEGSCFSAAPSSINAASVDGRPCGIDGQPRRNETLSRTHSPPPHAQRSKALMFASKARRGGGRSGTGRSSDSGSPPKSTRPTTEEYAGTDPRQGFQEPNDDRASHRQHCLPTTGSEAVPKPAPPPPPAKATPAGDVAPRDSGAHAGRGPSGEDLSEVQASALKGMGSRSDEVPRRVSFVDDGSSDSEGDTGAGRDSIVLRATSGGGSDFRQLLATPGKPSGSYRRQVSEEGSLSLSEDSVSSSSACASAVSAAARAYGRGRASSLSSDISAVSAFSEVKYAAAAAVHHRHRHQHERHHKHPSRVSRTISDSSAESQSPFSAAVLGTPPPPGKDREDAEGERSPQGDDHLSAGSGSPESRRRRGRRRRAGEDDDDRKTETDRGRTGQAAAEAYRRIFPSRSGSPPPPGMFDETVTSERGEFSEGSQRSPLSVRHRRGISSDSGLSSWGGMEMGEQPTWWSHGVEDEDGTETPASSVDHRAFA